MPRTETTEPQKFKVNFKWAKTERASYNVFAQDEEQAQAIAQAMFRENYTPDCRIQEFTTIETVTK